MAKTPKKKKPQLVYELVLNFPEEPRVSEYRPTDFGAAVEYALDFARRNKGVKVEVGVVVPTNPLVDHTYTLFACEFPALVDFMRQDVLRHFGALPD